MQPFDFFPLFASSVPRLSEANWPLIPFPPLFAAKVNWGLASFAQMHSAHFDVEARSRLWSTSAWLKLNYLSASGRTQKMLGAKAQARGMTSTWRYTPDRAGWITHTLDSSVQLAFYGCLDSSYLECIPDWLFSFKNVNRGTNLDIFPFAKLRFASVLPILISLFYRCSVKQSVQQKLLAIILILTKSNTFLMLYSIEFWKLEFQLLSWKSAIVNFQWLMWLSC